MPLELDSYNLFSHHLRLTFVLPAVEEVRISYAEILCGGRRDDIERIYSFGPRVVTGGARRWAGVAVPARGRLGAYHAWRGGEGRHTHATHRGRGGWSRDSGRANLRA